MGSLFNYENKVMQVLMVLGDLIILNVMFIFFSIPIITMGAAQAGLYSGLRVLTDKEDDSSCAAAFWKGFTSGFTRITPVWCVLLVLLVMSILSLIPLQLPEGVKVIAMPKWISLTGIGICMIFISLTTWFHARFSCTRLQLIKNAWLIFLAHPLRSILISLINAIPLIVLLYDGYTFMQFTLVFLTIAFSGLSLASFTIMRKPFQSLVDMYNEKNPPAPAPESEDERIFHDVLPDPGDSEE